MPYFDPITERCPGCDGHWKCYCPEDEQVQGHPIDELNALINRIALEAILYPETTEDKADE